MKHFIYMLLCVVAVCLCAGALRAEIITVASPDKALVLALNVDKSRITYTVSYKGSEVVNASAIGLRIGGKDLTVQPKVKKVLPRSVNETIVPLYGKFARLQDFYNEQRVELEGNYSLVIRAYNEGVAYRFVTNLKGQITVDSELAEFNVAGKPAVFFPETNTFTTWEVTYFKYQSPQAIEEGKYALTPTLFANAGNAVQVLVAEADLHDYPGMYLQKTKTGFRGHYAPYPDSLAMGSWSNFVTVVKRAAPYIARTQGAREFPWRVVVATSDERTLLTNEIVYKLSSPQAAMDFAWVKPGKATWEWWHDAQLPGDSTPSGMKNRGEALYKRYVDFAAENNIPYLMWDAGWSQTYELWRERKGMNVREVIRYAKSKGVDVFLWCVAAALRDDADRNMDTLRSWGCAGLKVDFFDRDDQQAQAWLETIAHKAAERKLMLDFHGCTKPTGLSRKYPNVLNYEAVRGAECAKWDLTPNPEHHLIIPFTRMLAGAMDYTPGSMRNRNRQSFKPLDPGMPLTMGTRCHELAMYVLYDQYFAMLCDSPSEYNKYPDLRKLLAEVPVSYDTTIALSAKVCEYAVVAKRSGDVWYVGGMTDWTAREAEVDFSFLPKGKTYTAEVFSDGYDANMNAESYRVEKVLVNADSKMNVRMASGGGVVVQLKINN
jgi:alpha-glucosidase